MPGGPALKPVHARLLETPSAAIGLRLGERLVEWPRIHSIASQGCHYAGSVAPRGAVNVNGLVLRILNEREVLFGLARRGKDPTAQRDPEDICGSMPPVINIGLLTEGCHPEHRAIGPRPPLRTRRRLVLPGSRARRADGCP